MRRIRTKQSKTNRILHIVAIVFIIIVICGVAGAVVFRYQVEGETNAVFDISKILVISTAEAVSKEIPTAKWDCTINQDNDLYITIEKNKKKHDVIKSVTINNIQVIQAPSVGNMTFYRPAETGLFRCDDNYKIENELKYIGSTSGSVNNLEISNQGGSVLIRFCNENVGEFISNEDEQITHDGTLLKKTNTTMEQLNSKVQFDIIIETEKDVKYKATVNFDFPVGNIIEEGTSTKEINTDEIVLKRM